MSKLKYLLVPVTMLLWYMITYYSLLLGLKLMFWMFTLSWTWLFIVYFFLIGIVFGLVGEIPAIINHLILKIYNSNWLVIILHTIAGALGVYAFYYMLNMNPPTMENGVESLSLMEGLWKESKLKTILLSFTALGLLVQVVYVCVLHPIIGKLVKATKKP